MMFQNHMVTCKIFTLESVKVFIQNYYQKWCLKDQNLLSIIQHVDILLISVSVVL